MATQPPPPDHTDPIDPTIPGELPPVITPDQEPGGPEGLPQTNPDRDEPGRSPSELPAI